VKKRSRVAALITLVVGVAGGIGGCSSAPEAFPTPAGGAANAPASPEAGATRPSTLPDGTPLRSAGPPRPAGR
jgi:hypothetical protein